ncbi:uncharacterized protein LOC127253927 isoform X2 [Andrographis paniculata]|uniref:uncharacterized protein LOC127253927 isoform X2 n=1 Tax=Andrographis paniculata TaxID=175694 RepID=UPI0021E8BF35|nr:uncharacterized protein LOC127253927 isoform X2 [Andrographis paniculata]
MRGQGGLYGGDSGGGRRAYGGGRGAAQQHHQSNKSGYYQGRHQDQQPIGEKDGGLQNNQWRWEGDDAQMKLPLAATFSDGQLCEMPGSYYQGQRLDPMVPLERQGGGETGSQAHEEDMEIGYEDPRVVQTYESLEQRFLDDLTKLSKEHADSEDAENARHRERLNAISAQYGEQFAMIRAQHAAQREEFLRRESLARQQQYQQMVMQNYQTTPSDPRAFDAAEPHRAFNSDSYSARGQFPANARDQPYEPKIPYPNARDQPYEPKAPYLNAGDQPYEPKAPYPNAWDNAYIPKVPYPKGRAYNNPRYY